MKKNLYLSFIFLLLCAGNAVAQLSVTGPVPISTVCTGGTLNLSVTASGCTTYAYQWYSNSVNTNTGGTKIDGQEADSFSPSTLTPGTYYYYCVVTADCGTFTSDPAKITVNAASAGGTISGSSIVCSGSNSTTLELKDYTGSIIKWQYSIDDGASYEDITNTSSTQIATDLTQTTKYRTVVQSGVCPSVNSTDATVTVNPISVGGSITGSTSVCSGTNTTTLNLTGYTGTIEKWQYSTDDWSTFDEISNTTSTQVATDLTMTTKYRVLVKSGVCSVAMSDVATISVNEVLPASVSITGSNPVCEGTSVTFTAVAVNGGATPSFDWYNGITKVSSGSNTYTYTPLDGDVIKVIMTSSKACVSGSPATSAPVTMTVNRFPAISAMTASIGSDTPFSVSPVDGINGTVPSGTKYSWGLPTVEVGITLESTGSDQTSITGTLHNSKSGAKKATYKVTPKAAECTGADFNLVVTVYPKPVVSSKTVTICSGDSFSITPSDGVDGDVIPSGTTYSWSAPGSPAEITGRASGTNASSISGTLVNNSNLVKSVVYNVTPKSGTQTGSLFSVTVTVNPSPKLSGASQDRTICAGSAAIIKLFGLIPSSISTIGYSIDGIPQTPVMDLHALADGTANFNTPVLSASMDGKILKITSIINTGLVPECSSTFNEDVILDVEPIPTFGNALLNSPVCAGDGAVINLTGLLPSSVFTISYQVDGVPQTDFTGCASDELGIASFTSALLPASKNGKILRITGIKTTSGIAGCSLSTSKDVLLIINSAPIVTISGATAVCSGSDKTYTTQAGLDTYTWNVTGGVITGGDGTHSLTVTWGAPGTGKISLISTLNSCPSALVEQNVSISAIPVPVISGPSSVCVNSTGNTYSTEGGMTGYTWTITGGTIVPPDNGNVIVVNWTASGSQTITVNYTNTSGCTASSSTSYNVNVNPLPVITIAGPDSPRITSDNNYTTQAGMSGYSWIITGGGSWTSSGNTSQVTWNTTGSKTVSVNYTDSKGCTASSSAIKTVTVAPLPSVSAVSITGYPGIGETLTGAYTYSDGNGGSEVPTYRWLRNGTDPVSTAKNYVPVDADKDKTLIFEVTPVSTVGPPYTNISVRSTPTAPIEDMTGLPVAEGVCIEGIRAVGNTIRGKYFYNYSKAEGASIYNWFRKDTVSGVTELIGNNIEYTLTNDDIGDRKEIYFEITPVSSNFIPRTGTPVRSRPLAKILGLKDTYSVVEPSKTLTANIKGGVFSGPGVGSGIFSPAAAGAGGPYTIYYFINHINTHHICSQQASEEVTVNPNVAYFLGFDNIYCHDGPTDIITASHVPAGSTNLKFSATNMSAIISQTDSVVTINPGNMRAGTGRDSLIFSYEKASLKYVIKQPFIIDSVGTAIKIVNLDSSYCRTIDKHFISVEGIFPSGGTYEWTSSVLTSKSVSSAYVDPMLGTAGLKYALKYRYKSVNGCYSKQLTHYVKINSLPDPDFNLDSTYNIDGGAVALVARTTGGVFTGEGVAGNKFFPDIAGLSDHTIRYTVTAGSCTASTDKITNVRNALGAITGINSGICYSNTTYHINVISLPTTGVLNITGFTNKKGTLHYVPGTTTADYNVPAAGEGADTLVFSYTWDGVPYHLIKSLYIDKLDQVVLYNLTPGSKICDDTTSFKLNASITGGVFSGPVDINNKFVPSLATLHDTVKYVYTSPKTGCKTSAIVPVTVNPAPKVKFEPRDVCIENDKDSIMFLNKTVSTDAVRSWKWDFYDEGVPYPDYRKNAGYLYLKTGLQRVSLTATTVNGCSVTKDSTMNIGRRPEADFYIKDDCMHPGGTLKLVDTTILSAPVISRSWIAGGTEFSTSVKTALFPKNDTGYIAIRYIVRTNYPNCIDTVNRKVYIRPTITIPVDGYSETFDNGRSGWMKSEPADSIWAFGTPDGSVINSAYSGSKAWYTDITPKGAAAVESPCFNFISSQRPLIKMKLWRMFERDRDGVALQYKIGDSRSWNYVGTINDGIEWYNSAVIRGEPGGNQLGWTTIGAYDTKWKESIHTLDELAGKTDVKFRMVYGSEGSFTSHDGFAFDNIWIGERNRNVLLEHFTNITSSESSSADALVNKIVSDKKEDVINIQYHTNFPGTDPFYENNPGDASARILFYGLTRAPYTFVDGGFSKNEFAGIFDNLLAPVDSNEVTRRSLMSSPFNISLEPEVFGGILTIKGKITALDTAHLENLTLFLVVTEKVNSFKYTGAMGETRFYNVFRKFIPDAGGITLKNSWAKSDSFIIPEKTWTIQSILDASDIEVIAFLQNTITKQIYQTSSIVEPNVIVGLENTPAAGNFAIYPNPAKDRISINFSEPLKTDADIRIFDIRGVVVRTYRVGSGISSYTIENSGLKGGIYMLRVSLGKFETAFKKLIITED
jgi:hypothetical protein